MAAANRSEDEGALIVLEGIDGSGKSTLAARIADHLDGQGHPVHRTAEPTATFRGQAVRQALADPDHDPVSEALLFAADHAAHVAELRRHLAAGRIVISDRYSFSCLAYQGATLAEAWTSQRKGTPVAWLEDVLEPFELAPDLVLLLDLPVELAIERVDGREAGLEKFEQAAFLEDVADGYRALAEAHGFTTIDAAGTLEETLARCLEAVDQLLDGGAGG